MPRKASAQLPEVIGAIQKIDEFRHDAALSVLALSRASSVSQPALARFLAGERKTVTSSASKVLRFIDQCNKQHNWHNQDGVIPAEIEEAVRALWDGTQESTDLVASVIKALKPVLEIATFRARERSGGETT